MTWDEKRLAAVQQLIEPPPYLEKSLRMLRNTPEVTAGSGCRFRVGAAPFWRGV